MALSRTLVPAVILAAAVVALTALAHDSAPTPTKPAPAPAAAASKEKGAVIARGEKLKGLQAVKLAELVAAPDKYVAKSVRVEGTVRKACTKAGCWMELAESAAPGAAGVRVIMKDHGFFVPTDSAGSKATVEGTVAVETLDEGEAQHFVSEGGSVSKDKDGKAREVHLTAVGVELVRS